MNYEIIVQITSWNSEIGNSKLHVYSTKYAHTL